MEREEDEMGQKDHSLEGYVTERLTAAESGRVEALYDLGLLYSTGQGVSQDYIEAHKWFNLAAIRGVKRAEIDRAEVAKDMNRIQISEAQKQARRWLDHH